MIAAATAAAWTSAACAAPSGAEPWVDTRQVGPFVCQATCSLDPYAAFFAELEKLDDELIRTLGIEAAREPIYVYLFSNAQSHRQYIERQFPAVPYRRALFVKEGGQAGVYAYRHDELQIDLRHECTHALLHASLPLVPLWLDEGLAEYFEVPADERAFDHPHFDSLRWNLRLGMIRDLPALEEPQDLSQMGAFEYRYAWAWVHFMLHGPESAHATLVRYLADVRRGAATEQLSARFAATMPDATDRMVQHFKHWRR